jgi:hypothetical protein
MWGLIIPAIATLGGALIGSRSANKAGQQQMQSTDKALQFEREREARRIQEYNERQAAQRQYMEQWNAARAGLLKRWGIPMGGTLGSMSGPTARASSVGQERVPLIPQQPQGQVNPQAQPTLATMDNWNDWQGYMPAGKRF